MKSPFSLFSYIHPKFSLMLLGCFCMISSIAYALDGTPLFIAPKQATSSGSNNSRIETSTGATACTSSGATCVVNAGNDATTIGNYFQGYYYDSQLGFFRLNWSANPSDNVRVVASTNKCSSGYGYRLGGYAYGADGGLINFSYSVDIPNSPDIFVYYCESDQLLHGYAYHPNTGFQSFEGITLQISGNTTAVSTLSGGTDPFFVNNSTMILTETPSGFDTIQSDRSSTVWGKEAIFYIIK